MDLIFRAFSFCRSTDVAQILAELLADKGRNRLLDSRKNEQLWIESIILASTTFCKQFFVTHIVVVCCCQRTFRPARAQKIRATSRTNQDVTVRCQVLQLFNHLLFTVVTIEESRENKGAAGIGDTLSVDSSVSLRSSTESGLVNFGGCRSASMAVFFLNARRILRRRPERILAMQTAHLVR